MSAQTKGMTQNPYDGTNVWGVWPGYAVVGALGGFAVGSAANIALTYHGLPLDWTHSVAFAIRHALHPIEYGSATAGAVLLAAKPLWRWLNGNTSSPDRVIRGSQLTTSKALGKKTVANNGIHVHPSLRLTAHDETAHELILGGSGSGKTTILWPQLIEAHQRRDRQMIFSYKGDFQERWPSDFTLLAPWDARSAVWELGADVLTSLDAEALAETLIQEPKGNSDPIWTDGARQLLAAIIFQLQHHAPGRWTAGQFASALEAALGDFAVLARAVKQYHPIAAAHIAGGPTSKTTASFLSQLSTAGRYIRYLAQAEAGAKDAERWSARRWARGKGDRKTVILGYLPSSEGFSRAFAASIIEMTVLRILDLPDVEPAKRRIWLVLDEVAQAGKVPSITTALEAGRSKGLRLILGLQSTKQVHRTYDEHTQAVWAGQTATKVIARVKEPDDQRWASSLTGEVELDRMQTSTSTSVGKPSGTSTSKNYQRVREPVLLPAQIGKDLYAMPPEYVRALVMSEHGDAILDWPFRTPPQARPAFVPAGWMSGSAARRVGNDEIIDEGDAEGERERDSAAGVEKTRKAGRARPAVTKQRTAQQRLEVEQKQDEKPREKPREREEESDPLADKIADQIESQALDALLPGAGTALDLGKTLGEAFGGGQGGPAAPAASRFVQQSESESDQEQEERLEHER